MSSYSHVQNLKLSTLSKPEKNQIEKKKEKVETTRRNMEVKAVPFQQVPCPQQDPRLASRGIAPGGVYETEKYCGLLSVIIGVFALPCICCCPIDQREVYLEPGTGRKVILSNLR